MFCKWCGKTIRETDEKCPNCGRVTPPMSDCGGFYNLITPDAPPRKTRPTPSQGGVDPTIIDRFEKECYYERRHNRAKHKLMFALLGIVAVLLIGSIALGVRTTMKLSELEEKISQLHTEETEPTEAPTEEQSTEEGTEGTENTEAADETAGTEETVEGTEETTQPTEAETEETAETTVPATEEETKPEETTAPTVKEESDDTVTAI